MDMVVPFLQTNLASEAVSAASTAATNFDSAPIVKGLSGFIPTVLGLVAAGVGMRKIISWFRKALKSL